jgi:Bifunctional DNA primase/polymerase, N-terminal
MSALLDVALDYAARGWAAFPLQPRTKEPATKRGFYDATTNPATLQRWFARFYYNVGIRTGAASGVFIVDIDGEAGASNLRALEAEHGPLPATLASITARGQHLWFRAAGEIPCSTGRVAPGIDVRADGGYVVTPPSVHPNGAVYRWIDYSIPPTIPPDWLIRLAQRPQRIAAPAAPINFASNSDAYGRAALEREIEALSQVEKGARNHALNLVSFRLHQLVAGGELSADEVQQRLLDAAQANGLMSDPEDGPRKTLGTINSGARAGLQFPRRRSERR